jgi:glyoxylase-like metal-dependent hydrolase (beta-lactamase superfamily II)
MTTEGRVATELHSLATGAIEMSHHDEHEATPPWDAARVNLTSKELAPGVFAVMPDDVYSKDHVATTAGFIIGERGVLVVEAMLNGDLASQLIGLIRKETSKPIRFLVNTSYHGDHAYGNYVFPDSTVIIHHPATKQYMDEKFEDDRAFMLGLMGKGKGIERVQSRSADITVSDMITVDLGGRKVEIRHFGFAQTPGDLVIWEPDAKVLWVGNMIQAPSPALPWLLEGRHRDTIDTLTRVREFLPEDATIIPGHGRPMKPADIDFPIRYLRELDTAVAEAVATGHSVESTLEKVGMSNYGEYSLFDWAHNQVNVPAAYAHHHAAK